MKWAQQDSLPISKGIRRKVLFSRKTLYTRRLYHPLGADLWILKARESLKKLIRSPASYARGQVWPPHSAITVPISRYLLDLWPWRLDRTIERCVARMRNICQAEKL